MKIILRRFDDKEPALHTETIDDHNLMDVVFEVNGKRIVVSVRNGWLDVRAVEGVLVLEPVGANAVNIRSKT